MVKVKTNTNISTENESVSLPQLILFNDDFNTFDYVVETLVDVCEHDPLQAEQCTWITHYRGKCAVKQGEKSKLIQIRKSITERGLIAEIQ